MDKDLEKLLLAIGINNISSSYFGAYKFSYGVSDNDVKKYFKDNPGQVFELLDYLNTKTIHKIFDLYHKDFFKWLKNKEHCEEQ